MDEMEENGAHMICHHDHHPFLFLFGGLRPVQSDFL